MLNCCVGCFYFLHIRSEKEGASMSSCVFFVIIFVVVVDGDKHRSLSCIDVYR